MGVSVKKILNSTVGLAEGQTHVIPRFEELNDNVGITDAALESMQKLELNDVVGSTETVTFILGFNKVFDETIGVTETNDRVPGFFDLLASTLGIAEGIVTVQPFGPQLVESIVGVTEDLIPFIVHLPTNDETIGITEGNLHTKVIVEIFDSTIGVTETEDTNLGVEQIEVINNTVGLTDTEDTRFYQDVGLVFKYVTSNYADAVNWFVEARATGAFPAITFRLFNITDRIEVPNSIVIFQLVGTTEIKRSSAFILEDGKEYQVQIGREITESFLDQFQARLVGARN